LESKGNLPNATHPFENKALLGDSQGTMMMVLSEALFLGWGWRWGWAPFDSFAVLMSFVERNLNKSAWNARYMASDGAFF